VQALLVQPLHRNESSVLVLSSKYNLLCSQSGEPFPFAQRLLLNKQLTAFLKFQILILLRPLVAMDAKTNIQSFWKNKRREETCQFH
jgi:hypothetical protein